MLGSIYVALLYSDNEAFPSTWWKFPFNVSYPGINGLIRDAGMQCDKTTEQKKT